MLPLALMGFLLSATLDPTILTVPLDVVVETHASTTQELAAYIATKHGLNVNRFLKTIECESGWNARAVGDNGTSFGLAQIHYPARDWGITREDAYTPEIALEIMAQKWEDGEAWRWSCWSSLFASSAYKSNMLGS
jgi:hypothetical protein